MFDMITSIFRNLGSKPATRLYPFEKRENFKDTRGQISGVDIDACIFCSICEKKCPALAIKVNKAEKSWEINQMKCIVCNVCSEACPKKCILTSEQYKAPVFTKHTVKEVQQPKEAEAAPTQKA